MKRLIRWLKLVEFMQFNLYSKSAEIFKEDKKLSRFLRDLAEDESYLNYFISCSSQYLQNLKYDIPLDVDIDENIKKKIEAPLVEYTMLIDTNRMHNKSTILKAIFEIETSDLNEILNYAIQILKKFSVVFQYTATKLQIHKKRIYKYFKSIGEESFFLNVFKEKEDFYKCKIIIIDNNEIAGKILKDLLKKKVKIVTSRNYSNCIDKLYSNYFDIVIANFNLSEYNGIDFYRKVTKRNIKLTDNFIFYAKNFEPSEQGFLSMNNIQFLYKPVSLAKVVLHCTGTI